MLPMPKSILIVTGEASGDKHGANLALELKQSAPQLQISAMGGEALGSDVLAKAGIDIVVDNRGLAVMGIVEVLRHYPDIRRALNTLTQHLKDQEPDLLVLIDYAEFNLKLAAQAKKLGIPVLFYISPKFWAWREKRVNRIKRLVDMMAVIFPFEVEFYEKHGVPVRYVGNPLAGKVVASQSKADSLQHFGLNSDHPVIGIFPGSRRSEISRMLPVYLDTKKQLQSKHPNAQYLLPLAPGVEQHQLEQWIATSLPTDIKLVSSDKIYDAMQCCNAAMVTMGTVTLEAALMQMPMLTANKIAGITYHLVKNMVSVDYFTLANIVAEKEVVKEYIQYEAASETFKEEINRILSDSNYRKTMTQNLQQVKNKIGNENGSANVAELVLEMLATTDQPD